MVAAYLHLARFPRRGLLLSPTLITTGVMPGDLFACMAQCLRLLGRAAARPRLSTSDGGAAFAQTLEPLQGRDSNLHPSGYCVAVHEGPLGRSLAGEPRTLTYRSIIVLARQSGRNPGSHAGPWRTVLLVPSVATPTRILSITATAPVINTANSVVQNCEFIGPPSLSASPFHIPE